MLHESTPIFLDPPKVDRIMRVMPRDDESEALIVVPHSADLTTQVQVKPVYNPALVYLAGLQSAVSRETMEQRLRQVAAHKGVENFELFPWTKMTFAEMESIRADFAAKYSPATVNLTLCAMRGVFKAAWRLEQIDGNTYQMLKSVESIKGFRLPPGRSMTEEETNRLRAAFEKVSGPYGAMLRGLTAVMLGAGLRREEVCKLPVGSLRGRKLHVIGKGNKERAIPLTPRNLDHFREWQSIRKGFGIQLNWEFFRVTKNGFVHDKPFSTDAFYNLVTSWGPIISGSADDPARITPHDFRRTYATRLLEKGVDVLLVQKLLGHEKTETTGKYDRRPDQEVERAVLEADIY
jgi:site-specific recombinase XerD